MSFAQKINFSIKKVGLQQKSNFIFNSILNFERSRRLVVPLQIVGNGVGCRCRFLATGRQGRRGALAPNRPGAKLDDSRVALQVRQNLLVVFVVLVAKLLVGQAAEKIIDILLYKFAEYRRVELTNSKTYLLRYIFDITLTKRKRIPYINLIRKLPIYKKQNKLRFRKYILF